MKNAITLMLCLAFARTVPAQHGGSDTPIANLSFIIGEWEGTGWMLTPQGKQYSQITEKAECKLDCSIIAVSGLGTKTDSLTQETIIVHDAFGIITYDTNAGRFYMRAYKKDDVTETEIEFIEEKVIRWNLSIPQGGTIRFTADFSEADRWKETGEFSPDGVRWVKMLETLLERKL